MKGTKPPKKATIILCLSFPNKAMNLQLWRWFRVRDHKNNQKNFFLPIEIKNWMNIMAEEIAMAEVMNLLEAEPTPEAARR